MLKAEIIETVDGTFVVLPNDTLGQHLKRGERWEPHFTKIVQGLLNPGDTAVDIGANIGCNTISMAHAVGEKGRVFAFEPLRITFQQLCANIILNGFENVFTHQIAVGSGDNLLVSMVAVDYHTPDINIMNTCVGVGGDEVMMMTLDSFQLSGVTLLKIDVQGCELLVLQGSMKTIERNRPVIFIEIEEPQLRHANTSSEEVMMHLLKMNYNLIWLKGDSLCDWMAVPREREDVLTRVKSLIESEYEMFYAP